MTSAESTAPRREPLSPLLGADPPGLARPPWPLTGQAVVVLLRERTRSSAGVLGAFSAIAFVDYATSGVGPYRELLHIPRVTRWQDALGASVAGIWVTSGASAVSGNHNWGLTKGVAQITREPARGTTGGAEVWHAADSTGVLGALTHRPFGPELPVGKPKGVGPLLQRRDGIEWITPVGLRGWARPTRVESLMLDADRLTDVDHHRILGAVAVTRGAMTFHPAEIRAAGG